MEGLGGPIRMDEYSFDGIDPTLDACCQREVRRRNVLHRIVHFFVCNYSSVFFPVFVFEPFRYPTLFLTPIHLHELYNFFSATSLKAIAMGMP